ncbi:MAG: hypothetical protein VR78_06355 [Hoeflea sp. BRH_c9]|nr:MAG: hypothetical protein VR78_06355 [Hoeflea sp. BRH_c9]
MSATRITTGPAPSSFKLVRTAVEDAPRSWLTAIPVFGVVGVLACITPPDFTDRRISMSLIHKKQGLTFSVNLFFMDK